MDEGRRQQTDLMTRRGVLKVTGAATVLACGGAGHWQAAQAQEASPAASPVAGNLVGQHVVIRIRTIKPDHDAEEILAQIQEGFVPLLEAMPGLAWYVVAANLETRGLFSVGVFADEAEIAASNRAAGEWVAANIPDVFEGEPAIHDGVIGVAALASAGDLLGKYVVIRLREPSPDWAVDEVMHLIGEGYVPLVEAIPGFVAYFGSADAETGGQAYVTIFDDLAGTEESTSVAGEWLKANDYTFFAGDPAIVEGEIGAAADLQRFWR